MQKCQLSYSYPAVHMQPLEHGSAAPSGRGSPILYVFCLKWHLLLSKAAQLGHVKLKN